MYTERIKHNIKSILVKLPIKKQFNMLIDIQKELVADIEKANSEKQRAALARTSMYQLSEAQNKLVRSKLKDKSKLLFRVVNLYVIVIDSYECSQINLVDRETLNILETHKNTILANRSWYLKVIPESKWLIEYLQEL